MESSSVACLFLATVGLIVSERRAVSSRENPIPRRRSLKSRPRAPGVRKTLIPCQEEQKT